MRRIPSMLVSMFVLGGLLLLAACSKDQDARDDLQATQDSLNAYHQVVYQWQLKVVDAICQLEVDVYDVLDSGGDERAAGPPSDQGANRLCPEGPGDPDGRPPPPPEL